METVSTSVLLRFILNPENRKLIVCFCCMSKSPLLVMTVNIQHITDLLKWNRNPENKHSKSGRLGIDKQIDIDIRPDQKEILVQPVSI